MFTDIILHKYEDFSKARDFVSCFQIILASKHINALFSNGRQWTSSLNFIDQPKFRIVEALSRSIK